MGTQAATGDKLFGRFYGRVSEKLFKKFLFYSLNRRELSFTATGLLELFDMNEQLRATEKWTFAQY